MTSDAQKAAVSKALKGIPRTQEVKEAISKALTGIKRTPEQVEKNRTSHLGIVPWNKGLSMTKEYKERIRLAALSKRVVNTDLSNGSKQCKSCGIIKPISEFYKAQTTIDKLQSNCKVCDYEKRYGNKIKVVLE